MVGIYVVYTILFFLLDYSVNAFNDLVDNICYERVKRVTNRENEGNIDIELHFLFF